VTDVHDQAPELREGESSARAPEAPGSQERSAVSAPVREVSTGVGTALLLAFASPALGLMMLSAAVLLPVIAPSFYYMYKSGRADRRESHHAHPRVITEELPGTEETK
jgi:hypothetical protein